MTGWARRVPRRDRRWARDSLNVLLSGIEVGGRDAVAANVVRALQRGSFPRLGWQVTPGGGWYRSAPAPDAVAERLLHAGPPVAAGDPVAAGRFVTELSNRDDLPWPLAVLVGEDYLAVRTSHLIGDGANVNRLFCALAGQLDAPSRAPVGRPYATAVSRFVRQDPRAAARLLRTGRPAPPAAGPPAAPIPFRPGKRTLYARMDGDAFAQLRQWRKREAGASLAAVLLVGLVRALAEAGVSLHPAVSVLFDLRRYLRGPVDGNFVVGVDHVVHPETAPAQVGAAIAATATSGRPLLTYGAMMARRGGRADEVAPVVDPAVRLTFSSMGRPRDVERLPWSSALAPSYLCAADPAGGNGLTAIVDEVGGPPQFSLTFHTSVVPAAAVQAALDRLTRDPLAVLAPRPSAARR